MLEFEGWGKAAFDGFHKGCDKYCPDRGKWDSIPEDIKKGWIDAALEVLKEDDSTVTPFIPSLLNELQKRRS